MDYAIRRIQEKSINRRQLLSYYVELCNKPYVSLSTIVLNSRDWYGFRKILRFQNLVQNQPCNRLYPKKPAGMHW